MERLTERTADGILVKENYSENALRTFYQCFGGKPNANYSNCEEGYCAMEKLAAYEDAEEQGLLLRLPCKVGDKLYRITPYAKEPIITTHVLQINIKQFFNEKIIVRIDVMDKMGESCYFLDDIGKKVFLSRAEAEAKLAEMEGAE
jgi:hypothetical protein